MVRFKNRYLVCEVLWEDKKYDPSVKNKDFYDALRESIGTNFGDWGTGLLMNSLSVKYWNPATNIGIVRCLRDEFRLLWAGITFISHIRGRKVRIKVVYTAGTVRSCQKQVVRGIRMWALASQGQIEKLRKQERAEGMVKEVQGMGF